MTPSEGRARFAARWSAAAAALEEGPAFRLETGRRGLPTLISADGRALHSLYDPRAEAARLVRGAGIVPGVDVAVFGPGLGYLALAVAEALGPKGGHILLLEPFPRALAAGLETLDWSPVLDRPDVEVVAAAQPAAFGAALARTSGVGEGFGALVVNDAALALLDPAWTPIRERFADHLLRARSARRFSGDLTANLRANAARFVAARPVRGLFGAATGAAVVVAGAGPGLAEAGEALRAARVRFLLVAAAAALGPLEQLGIEADLAVLTDPQACCAAQTAGRAVPLVAIPTASAAALAAARGPLIGAVARGAGGVAWAGVRETLGEVDAGGSVVTTALDIALRMGAGRVALAGVDLSFGARLHAPGYVRDEAALTAASRFATAETLARGERPRRVLREKAVDGSTVETAENLLAYRRWIEGRIRRAGGVRLFQTSPRGLPIAGAEARPLAEALAGAPPAPRLRLPEAIRLDDSTRAAWTHLFGA